ncbi:MAG: type II toxin-antitoxin system PemK/MazF family toxin [Bacteroidia bacterium]|nr:type II toxin-antitoxin system PemK/MazF family toxin [Bacteroidia bacterium]
MDKLSFGEIVLLKFPYTDGQTFKRRPALIINDYNDGDIIVCRITSQIYKTNQDVYIENWEKSGLKIPSVIRVHKIATLEKDMVETVMGTIDEPLKAKIKT